MDGICSYKTFIAAHKPQLLLSGVPEYFWPTLCKKLKDQIFDSGAAFQLVKIDYDEEERRPYDPLWSVMAITDIDRTDSSHIYLIDHAWTFKANNIKNNLRNVPVLLERMCNLMQITSENIEEQINDVSKCVWKYANTYAVDSEELSVEDRVPVWYVMDELGSGITHSDDPNFRIVPFIYIPEQITFTLLFPVENVEEGDIITRNFIEGSYSNSKQRETMLIPWQHYDNFDDDFDQIEPDTNYFLEGHIVESLPTLEFLENRERSSTLKVYSEYEFINQYLNTPEFEIVNNEDEADVLWYINHFKNFRELSVNFPNKFVNQFPFEYVITIKDLLAIVARRLQDGLSDSRNALDTLPTWLPTTFNMKTELPQLAAYYMQRKKQDLNNHWICKPYNLARGLDTYITDNLDFLCRLPLSGPKIAQKYIENPVLFERPDIGKVKFDVRYVILLKSVDPTEVYIYKNFFLRFANKAFALDNFEDYEQHFTVMNYSEGVSLFKLLCADFKEAWNKQYPCHNWDGIEKSIFKMFSELFTAAAIKPPPCGIARSPQSRALYAADIMLSWSDDNKKIQPKLLEINWMPDCKRACEYYPNFYNDIFSTLFLDKDVSTCIKIL